MNLVDNPHHKTIASIMLQGISVGDGRHSQYGCGCSHYTGNSRWDLCQYHDGYDDAWEQAAPEPDDDPELVEVPPLPAVDNRPWTTIHGHLEEAERLLEMARTEQGLGVEQALALGTIANAHTALADFYASHADGPEA